MKVDFNEDGHGRAVLLIHSTVAGNKQWRKLIEYLSPNYRVLAPNLFGYGTTPEWSKNRHQTLIDQVDLLADFFEQNESISIVGHSFGGSVAMMAAKKYPAKIKKLILVEPNPFYLLEHHSDRDSYQEAVNLRDIIKKMLAKRLGSKLLNNLQIIGMDLGLGNKWMTYVEKNSQKP